MAGRRSPVAFGCAHDFGAKANQSGLPVTARLQPHAFPAEEDFCPSQPGLGPAGPRGLPQKLFLQPGNVPFGELSCVRQRSAARDGHAGGAVGTKAQDITPRPPVADEPEPHGLRAGQQPVPVRRDGRLGRPKEQFELHRVI